jgi:hypothetical protein
VQGASKFEVQTGATPSPIRAIFNVEELQVKRSTMAVFFYSLYEHRAFAITRGHETSLSHQLHVSRVALVWRRLNRQAPFP